MSTPILIYGAGAVGRNVRMILKEADPDGNFDGFLDDREPSEVELRKLEGDFLGGMEYLENVGRARLYVAIGDCAARRNVVRKLRETGKCTFPELIHPRAWIGDRVKLGEGAIVYPLAAIDVDVALGDFSMVNMQSSIGHDTVSGDYLTLSPGVDIGGNVSIGDDVFFGIRSGTIQGLSIGDRAHIGAGAMVIADVPSGKKVRAPRATLF